MSSGGSKQSPICRYSVRNAVVLRLRQQCTHQRHGATVKQPSHSPCQADLLLPTASKCISGIGPTAPAAPLSSIETSVDLVIMPPTQTIWRHDEQLGPATCRAEVKQAPRRSALDGMRTVEPGKHVWGSNCGCDELTSQWCMMARQLVTHIDAPANT